VVWTGPVGGAECRTVMVCSRVLPALRVSEAVETGLQHGSVLARAGGDRYTIKQRSKGNDLLKTG
jgi:hypothetical protein